MELTEDQEREIKAIMAEMNCDKGFACHKSQFEDLCAAHRNVDTNLIECKDVEGQACSMSYTFAGDMLICRCQLRKYVACKLGR